MEGADEAEGGIDEEELGDSDDDEDIPLAELRRKLAARVASLGPLARSPVGAPRKPLTMERQLEKLNILMPLFQSMAVKPNLQRLICAKANLQAYKYCPFLEEHPEHVKTNAPDILDNRILH